MVERKTVMNAAEGFHARPVSQFVQRARRFESRVQIVYGGKEADARSVVGLLGLAVPAGAEVIVRAEGPDAERAVDELSELLASLE